MPSADFLFLCVPSWEVRGALVDTVPYLSSRTTVISIARGIDDKSKKTTDEILNEFLPPDQHYGILAGPMMAEGLGRGLVGAGIYGSSDNEQELSRVRDLFSGTHFRLLTTSDIHGVALASALKNVYAIGLGIADGLGWGRNLKSFLIVKAVSEMALILESMRTKKETAYGLAGLGDLVAAGYSYYSHNMQAGYDIATTGKYFFKTEGIVSLSLFDGFLSGRAQNFPFLFSLQRVMVQRESVRKVFEGFIAGI